MCLTIFRLFLVVKLATLDLSETYAAVAPSQVISCRASWDPFRDLARGCKQGVELRSWVCSASHLRRGVERPSRDLGRMFRTS